MAEPSRMLLAGFVCALMALVASAGAVRAETGFDVFVERFEVAGDAPFVDAFDDGLRDTAPTSHFVDRGATELSEQGGALRLTDDDGAGGSPGFDLTLLDRPLRRGRAAATLTVSLRGGARGALRGLVLASSDSGAEPRGLVLVAGRGPLLALPRVLGSTPAPPTYVMGGAALVATEVDASDPPSPPGMAASGGLLSPVAAALLAPVTPAALCGADGEPIVVLTDGVMAACAELAAGADELPLVLRIEALAGSPLVRAAYSLDGGVSFVEANAWHAPAPMAGVALLPGAVFPGLLARAAWRPAARWIDYTGLATEGGITRGAGGTMVALEGVLSRQRFPSRPEAPIGADAGTFTLVAADGNDLRVAPGIAELETPRGRLRGASEPMASLAACAASVGAVGLGPAACSSGFGASVFGLASSEASLWLQSWTGIGGAAVRTDDPQPQPGTVTFQAGPICTRVLPNGQSVVLPGCRGPGDPGHDPAVDGPNPASTSIGFPAGVGGLPELGAWLVPEFAAPLTGVGYPGGVLDLPLVPAGGVHPFTGQLWRGDAAAASWNVQMMLVAFSAGMPDADPAETFDPAQPMRDEGCSFVWPGRCASVRAVESLAIEALPDDPDAVRPPLRWLWQLAASYRITEATGDFAALAGGRLLAVGPARSGLPGAAAVIGFYALPSPPIDPDGDGVREPKDRCPDRANPTQEDADTDRVGDACDVCVLDSDPAQRDTDGDGIGNRCDADLDNDGRVGLRDLVLLRTRLYTRDPNADLDGDGRVTLRDLARSRSRMFRPPGPAAPRLP